MALMLSALYDALLEAGASDDKARKAAEETAMYENRFDALEQRLTRIEGRFDTLQQSMDGRFNTLQQYIDGRFEASQQYIDGRFATLSSEVAHIRWGVYLVMGGIVTLILKAFFLP